MIRHEEALKILQELKDDAISVDRNMDSVFADFRSEARIAFQDIVDTLLRLSSEGRIPEAWEEGEPPLVGVLRRLRDSAEIFDQHEDDIIDDYQNWAESEKREIVETLLGLELDGVPMESDKHAKGGVVEPAAEENAQGNFLTASDPYDILGEAHAFDTAIGNCEWLIEHAQELRALLAYRSDVMINGNLARAMSAIETMRDALGEIEGFLNKKVLDSPARPLGQVLEDATLRAGKPEGGREEKEMVIG